MEKPTQIQKIELLVEKKDWRRLKNILSKMPEQDIAFLLSEVNQEFVAILFRLLPRQLALDVFAELSINEQRLLLRQLSSKHVRTILSEISPDDRTAIFEELPGEVAKRLLFILPKDVRGETLELLGYPKDSVGRLMTPEYVVIKPYWTVKRALAHIRKFGSDAETINMIYVVDDEWHLLDDIPLRKLILAKPTQRVSSLLDRKFIAVNAFEDQEKAANLMKKYGLVALPVINDENILLGIVTVDDILYVLEEETTEDMQKGASIVPLGVRYATASVWALYKKRILWLLFLTITGFTTVSILAAFKKMIAAIVALSFFIPILIDSGGNTGAQSAILVIRALALGDITIKKWFKVVRKELLIGLLLGTTLGAILAFVGYLISKRIEISMVVGLAMIAIVLWANIIGSLLPIVLTKFRLDPAIVSSPLITTLVDATGLAIYFLIASKLLF